MAGLTTGHRLRSMTEADIAEVMRLERALFPGDAWSEGMLRDEMTGDGRHYVVAESVAEGRIIGYAGLRAVPPEGDVQTIAVDAAHWGGGVGTALLTELLAEAHRRGVTDVFLEVRSDNPRAQRLYRRFGFTELGVRRGYYKDADAIVMRRSAPAGDAGEEKTR
ncbi:ribosomal protein S18-alanine N-acetyltransferase [Marinactinospora thermotolerans]|uniref:[SSU ribosomal protein S18P]-alanine acetyltransferase n=1 Tax=Marinactinospora thermotolerans DSM 45154 TaxID=1122192 RepID=A0A1T4SUR3_9ACTN|nr:ribosomal protein S18-alanine N-acetyltransferase [Marinactinospora thermotolerans]SKA32014.1 [SSU ribosomal protein S18P]-alanine acetyltransferase [Marinactinospora thermotolerans DSM 45154]